MAAVSRGPATSHNDEKKREKDEASRIYETQGLKGLSDFLESQLVGWENTTVKIALIGGSGSGKSTIANTLRRLKPKDDGAAKTGPNETTMEPTEYRYPKNNNIALWDLPGVGTTNFTRAGYLKRVNAETYDVFIIVTFSRLTENDLWLGETLLKMRKPVIFLRTKVDSDVANGNEEYDKSEETVLQEIKNHLRGLIDDHISPRLGKIELFLVNGKRVQDYEFEEFENTLLRSISSMQRQALLSGVHELSIGMLNRKVTTLKERMWKRVLLGVIGSAAVPGLSIWANRSSLKQEIALYKDFLGFDDRALQQLSNQLGVPVREFTKILDKFPWYKNDDESMDQVMLQDDSYSARRVLSWFPLIGLFAGAPLAYNSMKKMLHSILYSMEKAALEIIDKLVDLSKEPPTPRR